jgi:hypothetical protein
MNRIFGSSPFLCRASTSKCEASPLRLHCRMRGTQHHEKAPRLKGREVFLLLRSIVFRVLRELLMIHFLVIPRLDRGIQMFDFHGFPLSRE